MKEELILAFGILEMIGCILVYFYFVNETKKLNKKYPDQEQDNPYFGINIVYAITALVVFIGLVFYEYVNSTEISKVICINEIEEYSRTSLFGTTFNAYINKEYDLRFTRPNQYKVGDCIMIKRDKYFGWEIDD